MILQMPRYGVREKVFEKIIPTFTLDLTKIVQGGINVIKVNMIISCIRISGIVYISSKKSIGILKILLLIEGIGEANFFRAKRDFYDPNSSFGRKLQSPTTAFSQSDGKCQYL